jgi:hypothetical protein
MNEQHREIIELAVFDLESKSGVRWGPEYMEEFAAAIRAALGERDALAAQLAALKAHDPLAEMWRELSEYQPMADRDGHGESWAKMCRERTTLAAWAAASDADAAAAEAAWDAARGAGCAERDAAFSAQHADIAIDVIRRAKEGKS